MSIYGFMQLARPNLVFLHERLNFRAINNDFTFSCHNGAIRKDALRAKPGRNGMEKDQDNNTDKDPVTAVARKEKELTQHDLERARGGNDLAETFGRQNIGPAVATKQAFETKKKEDEKFENAMRQLLQQMREELERRLEELDRHIAETNAKIEELREELETSETRLEKQFGKDWQEKLKRGELDPDDPLLRQWLMQQQQLKDYLERREKLIKERDELEKQVAEIEGSNLPDHLKLERMEEILEQGTSPAVQKVWRGHEASKQAQEIAGVLYSENELKVETVNSLFPGFETVSVAGSGQFGRGIEAKVENIKSEFAKAAEPSVTDEQELVASNTSPFRGSKPST